MNALIDSVNYGFGLTTQRGEAFLKGSINWPDKPYRSLGLQTNFATQNSNDYFGLDAYDATENNLFANLIYESIFNNTNHKFRTGLSIIDDQITSSFRNFQFNIFNVVPGAFFEYTLTKPEKVTLLLGVRTDYSSEFGFFTTPRIHLKLMPAHEMTIRLSAGTGTRFTNLFTDFPFIMTTNRSIVISEKLKPEQALNVGVNISKEWDFDGGNINWTADFYRTDFINQTIGDMDYNPQEIVFSNLDGKSFANSFQTDVNVKWNKNFSTRAAYKFYDVRQTYHGLLLEQPLNPKQRALFNAAFNTNNSRWLFDFTTQWIGKQRLPNTSSNPEQYQVDLFSKPYFRLLGQVTWSLKNFDLYVGGENLSNFTQPEPIIAANEPFGKYFDSSIVWGPITGRMFYAGLRFKISKTKN